MATFHENKRKNDTLPNDSERITKIEQEIKDIKQRLTEMEKMVGMTTQMQEALDYMRSSTERFIDKTKLIENFGTLRNGEKFRYFIQLIKDQFYYIRGYGQGSASKFIRKGDTMINYAIKTWDQTGNNQIIKTDWLKKEGFDDRDILDIRKLIVEIYSDRITWTGDHAYIVKGKGYKPGRSLAV